MKAIVMSAPGGPEVLQLQEAPQPEATPDELLVRVRAAGLNRADLLQRAGGYPQPGVKPALEIPGMEFAGEVVRVGERVPGFAVGDRVMGLLPGACYAEFVTVHHRLAVKVPQNMSWHEAGGTPEVYITAHDALSQCGLVAGESALIHAAGSGVGVAAIQIAKAMGASLVVGTAGSDEKIAKAKAIGLDVGVNYKTHDFATETLAATDHRGVDVVLDVIGAEYWDGNMRALAPKGRMVLVGMMGGAGPKVALGTLMGKRLQVRGTTLRGRPLEEKGAAVQAFAKSVLPHLASGRVKVIVDRVFPLAEAGAAQEYLATNANFGKVILDV
jgi:putative PIG3 family NAD(P)H quinone oxidoreductase